VWEETREGSDGKPVKLLVMSTGTRARITFHRLTDLQVSFWFRVCHERGLFHEANLLRGECERRKLSTNPDDHAAGQRVLC